MPYLMALKALPWRLIGAAALALAIGLLWMNLRMERAHSAKLQAQLEKCEEFRRLLAEQSERQKQQTSRNIEQVRERIVTVEKQADRIERAPLKGDCSTPDEVLQADV